ncbi:MAG: ABC-F family ATP-binding cassette domain-containing protein [Acidaminobacteraceae bacterium]
MNIINVENLSKSYGEKALFKDISFKINEGDKIGLIGVNGTGKTTLLNILSGVNYADSGTVDKSKKFTYEYLSQNPDFDPNITVIEQVFSGDSKVLKLIRDYENTLAEIAEGNDSKDIQIKLLALTDNITKENAWEYESKIKIVLTKLGITEFSKKIGNLSGGQKKRVALASALINECDLLILDEPTNHMDSDSIMWLEDYLKSTKSAIIMVTHDRYFLDRVVNKTLELDHGSIYTYEGNYSMFLEKKMNRKELEGTLERKRVSLYKKELAWIRKGAKARTTKQKARIQRFDDISEASYATSDDSMEISVAHTRLGKKIVDILDISKGFDDVNLFKDFTYNIVRDDRIGIVGRNGSGKSTFLNIITGKLDCDSGSVDIGETVNISYFTQESVDLNESLRAIDYIKEECEFVTTKDGSQISASQMMERFLFDSNLQYTYIARLSGGEKRRLYLLRIIMKSPNVLILDEPTNDLDIDTLKVLEEYLDEFSGAVITVSHDRYFLDRVCNKIFTLDFPPKINISIGNYSDYLDHKKDMVEFSDDTDPVKEIKEKVPDKTEVIKLTYAEKMELNKIQAEIEHLESKLEILETDMTKSATDFVKLHELSNEKDEIEIELLDKLERQEYLNDKEQVAINAKK